VKALPSANYLLGFFALACLLPRPCAWGTEFSPPDIYRKASPAVVLILAVDPGRTGSAGTGSIISPDGVVLTNAHVITNPQSGNPCHRIYVILKPERLTGEEAQDLRRSYAAQLLARDPELDLALLRIEGGPVPMPVVLVGDSQAVSIGDPVAAIGHPEGGGFWTLTTGTISGIKRMGRRNTFQTETSINRGNSGGPLLDGEARLIGVNTSTVRRGADGMAIVGVNFAVKSEEVSRWLQGRGVSVASVPTERSGYSPDRQSPRRQAHPLAGQDERPQPPSLPAARVSPDDGEAVTPPPFPTRLPAPPATAVKRPYVRVIPSTRKGSAPGLPGEKEFHGAYGERMYGMPGRSFDLDRLVEQAVRKEAGGKGQ